MVKNTGTGTSSDWQDLAVRGSHTGRRPLPAVYRVDALTARPGARIGIPFLRLHPSRSATLPPAMKAHGGKRR